MGLVMSPTKQNTFPGWTKVRVPRESEQAIKRASVLPLLQN